MEIESAVLQVRRQFSRLRTERFDRPRQILLTNIIHLLAHELDLLTCPYVFTPEDAVAMAEAGADVLVPHMGLTTKGDIGGFTAPSLADAAQRVQAIRDAAVAVKPDILVLCHGGPIAEPSDAQYILDHTHGIAGFFGASSIERLSVEPAITEQAKQFKEIKLNNS